MKRLYYFLLFFTVWAWMACNTDSGSSQPIEGEGGPNSDLVHNPVTANQPVDTNQFARIRFEQPDFDFGTVNEGEKVEHVFRFTNTGKVPLVITKATSSCGCTVPEWPKDPIAPGQSGELRATFDTEGRDGEQKKLIRVLANSYPNETKLMLRGTVTPAN